MGARVDMGVSQGCLQRWFRGSRLQSSEQPRFAALDGEPSVKENPGATAMESGRLSGLGKISLYPENNTPAGPEGLSPSAARAAGKVRTARDWENPNYERGVGYPD